MGETDEGFTGSEIGRLLDQCGITDVHPDATKRHRLSDALLARQRQDNASNAVIRFITGAMARSATPTIPPDFVHLMAIPLPLCGPRLSEGVLVDTCG